MNNNRICGSCGKETDVDEYRIFEGYCIECYKFIKTVNVLTSFQINKQNAQQTFSNELTVNDIIRKINERKERLTDISLAVEGKGIDHDIHMVIHELDCLLDYIEKDEEY